MRRTREVVHDEMASANWHAAEVLYMLDFDVVAPTDLYGKRLKMLLNYGRIDVRF